MFHVSDSQGQYTEEPFNIHGVHSSFAVTSVINFISPVQIARIADMFGHPVSQCSSGSCGRKDCIINHKSCGKKDCITNHFLLPTNIVTSVLCNFVMLTVGFVQNNSLLWHCQYTSIFIVVGLCSYL